MTRPAIIVAGMGRCGTSLMMQMLHAAGVPCVGRYPAFETDHSSIRHFDANFIAQLGDVAMKLIDPKHFQIPDLRHHVVVWLDRDADQQAASALKLLGIAGGRRERRAYAKSLRNDRWPNIHALGHCSKFTTRFEDLIERPVIATGKISQFLAEFGWDIDPAIMAGQVVPRSSVCFDGMLELSLLRRVA